MSEIAGVHRSAVNGYAFYNLQGLERRISDTKV